MSGAVNCVSAELLGAVVVGSYQPLDARQRRPAAAERRPGVGRGAALPRLFLIL